MKTPIRLAIILLLITSAASQSTVHASSFTPEQRAEAERVARSKVFVGPKLPKTKAIRTSLADAPTDTPKPSRTKKPPAKPKHQSFDGTYWYNEDGGVIGMRTRCRPCWMVKAGIHRPRCCN